MLYAKEFLRFVLAGGPIQVESVLRMGKDEGLDAETIHDAFSSIGGLVERKGVLGAHRTIWSLPKMKPGNSSS
jgi:hypothetical protein